METRTFRAGTTKEALSRVSRELGPDAIIISQRKVKDSEGRVWAEVIAAPREGISGEPPVATDARASLFKNKAFIAAGLGGLAAVIILLAVASIVFWRGAEEGQVTAEEPITGSGPISIAVLPFANLSGNPDEEYFCDGLADEILNKLAKVGELKVIARESSFHFKGKGLEIQEIGERLKVTYVLGGSLRKSEDRIRITPTLMSVSDGSQIWSATLTKQMKDIFDLEDEIAFAVVDALKIELRIAEKENIGKRYTINPQVRDLLKRGDFFAAKWRMSEAIPFYEKAVAVDPDSATAWAGLAGGLLTYMVFTASYSEELAGKAEECVERALSLDPNLSKAYSAKASLLMLRDFDWDGVNRETRRALELDADNTKAYYLREIMFLSLGRFEEAKATLKKELEIDPFAWNPNFLLAITYYFEGKTDAAIDQLKTTAEWHPDFKTFYLSYKFACLCAAGRFNEAKEAAKEKFRDSTQKLIVEFSKSVDEIYEKNGIEGVLLGFKNVMKKINLSWRFNPHECMIIGEKDEALESLERVVAIRAGGALFCMIKFDPLYKPLHDHPRFIALLKKMNLAD
jgi:adenylate cyclase